MVKNLLITGGASGIGAQTARRAAARGYRVVINYRSRAMQAEAVAADIVRAGGHAVALPGDMAREADIVRLFEESERALGPITHLVNSAGIGARGRVADYDAAVIANLFAVNVTGLMLCCREAA
ncbi:MAG: SDR family NAD(P)-dependent oxidoreductase, partial [Alphaproteobacteria bacterium]|nr:SDR family NAD(P)-dependent oxidoreductase [Alphaproteobacteria bacterium]